MTLLTAVRAVLFYQSFLYMFLADEIYVPTERFDCS